MPYLLNEKHVPFEVDDLDDRYLYALVNRTYGIIKRERADDYTVQTVFMFYPVNDCLFETSIVNGYGEIHWIEHTNTYRKALNAHKRAKKFLEG